LLDQVKPTSALAPDSSRPRSKLLLEFTVDYKDMSEFPALGDQALEIVNSCVNKVLKDQGYSATKCSEWIDTINNDALDQLRALSPNFKYIVNCLIVQKIGAGIHYESVAHWDEKTDASFTLRFESDSMLCLCTITGVAI
jgi:dynein light chain Tctex-type 1